jgi:RluA family pseudouridine synthase
VTDSLRLVVLPRDAGLRLDQFLAAATSLSRRAARRLIETGSVIRNQEPLRVQSREVETGDVIDLLRPPEDVSALRDAPAPPPEVLFEDEWLLVANKPAGVLSQPAEHGPPDDLAFDELLLLDLGRRHGRRPFLRLVHRLDRLTSGAFLCALNPQALPPLTRAWSEGLVDRRYLALVDGHPDFDTRDVRLPIARDPDHAWRFLATDAGKPAHTELRVIDRGRDDIAVLECRLLTGRTHQVRVHLSAIGHPVVGDRLYGSRRLSIAERPLLHATMLALPHPRDGRPVRVISPPPDEIAALLGDEADRFIQAFFQM